MKNRKPAHGRQRHRQSPRQPSSVLLEVGTEDLPWQMIQPAYGQLAQGMEQLLSSQRISYDTIRAWGTPRRLAVIVEGIARRQDAARQECWGPPESVAFDSERNPTPAALGFAKSQGVNLDAVQTRETPKGSYLYVVKEEKGRPTEQVLAEHLPNLIESLTFPKAMRWNESGIRFGRPIRWVLALVGSKALPIHVAGVKAGKVSCGHRFLTGRGAPNPKSITISSPEGYRNTLERAGVVVDPDQRREILKTRLVTLARSAKGTVYGENEAELLEQAVFSVECPHAVLGGFASSYLTLPQEVLITSMQEHQGFFSLVGVDGKLLARFIAPTNMKLSNMAVITRGNERVLAARLADAQYFFHEDRKSKLVDRVQQLSGVIFHKKLGTLYQKTERMVHLASVLADASGLSEFKDACQRAALLSKADLTTGMVGEFPTLQGTMGREYAIHDGEAKGVCLAIGEHYQPRTPDDALPKTVPGKLLSSTDRLDTLTAFFRAGILPSGSEDPFGLRRQTFGLIRILIEGNLKINLAKVIQDAIGQLDAQGVHTAGSQEGPAGESRILEFIADRIRHYGRDQHDFREDVMDAVLAGESGDEFDVRDLFSKMKAVQAMTHQKDFDPLMIGYKRAHRIVDKEQWTADAIDSNLFEHQTEERLYQSLGDVQSTVESAIGEHDYSRVLKALIRLKPPIDDFFVGVLVNAEEATVRANRLSLLRRIDQLFSRVADFSRIQVQSP